MIENNDDGACVHTSDGRRIDADLVIRADGIHSAVREAVFGPEFRFIKYLGNHTAAFTFEDPVVSDQVRGRFALSDTRDRQIGLYGLRDGRVAAFLIHRDASPALPVNRREALRNEFAGAGWLAPHALDQAPEDTYYDVVAQIHMERWHSGRVVLVGDACQAVSLLAGQGSSLAVGRRAARWFLPSSGPELFMRRLMLKLSRLPLINRSIGNSLAGKVARVS